MGTRRRDASKREARIRGHKIRDELKRRCGDQWLTRLEAHVRLEHHRLLELANDNARGPKRVRNLYLALCIAVGNLESVRRPAAILGLDFAEIRMRRGKRYYGPGRPGYGVLGYTHITMMKACAIIEKLGWIEVVNGYYERRGPRGTHGKPSIVSLTVAGHRAFERLFARERLVHGESRGPFVIVRDEEKNPVEVLPTQVHRDSKRVLSEFEARLARTRLSLRIDLGNRALLDELGVRPLKLKGLRAMTNAVRGLGVADGHVAAAVSVLATLWYRSGALIRALTSRGVTCHDGRTLEIEFREHRRPVRIFNRSGTDDGGRIYRLVVHALPSPFRRCLFFDRRRTIEVDFKSMHGVLAYALVGHLNRTGKSGDPCG